MEEHHKAPLPFWQAKPAAARTLPEWFATQPEFGPYEDSILQRVA